MKILTIKLDDKDHEDFLKLCKEEGGNASVDVRQYIKGRIAEYERLNANYVRK